MTAFIAGAITFGHVLVGLFFLRFWRRTRDRLFAKFALAFWLLALNQGIVSVADIGKEFESWVYLLRAAAFSLIIAAILAKNLPLSTKKAGARRNA